MKKKPIAASKAAKARKLAVIHMGTPTIQPEKVWEACYLDKATLAALKDIDVTVQYRGRNVYLVHNKGLNHHQMFPLPSLELFNQRIKEILKVDISPLIIKHRQKECFTCKMATIKCLDLNDCGQPKVTNKK